VIDLRSVAPELADAIERVVDERVRELLADQVTETPAPWLTIEEASMYLRVSPRTLHRLLRTDI
jgi:hypothetical protein